MNYQEALQYIHSIQWRGSRLGLERTRELMQKLGNPEQKLKFIHIAGTNGKGSTAAMTASVLESAGYRVGLYVSPFITRFNERIQLNHIPIPDDELAELTAQVQPIADGMDDSPTEFELITAIGFLYFIRHNCDVVVLEVGMGGALDSTNVIPSPEVAVITNLGYDHTKELGSTLAEIASAKAGIIKPGCRVVSYGRQPEADEVIRKTCLEQNVPLYEAEHDNVTNVRFDLDRMILDYGTMKELEVALVGTYQQYNAAVALKIIEVLQENGWKISEEAVRAGMRSVQWPGRFEVLRRSPVFVADGGHNPQGVVATAGSLAQHFPGKKIVFHMGVMADKDVQPMLQQLAPLAERFITVRPDNPRAMKAEELAERIRQAGCCAESAPTVAEGVQRVTELTGNDGVGCAIGSLYMLGEVRACFNK